LQLKTDIPQGKVGQGREIREGQGRRDRKREREQVSEVKNGLEEREMGKEKKGKDSVLEDFSKEYLGKRVKIHLVNGEVLEGKIVESTRFFYKVFVDSRVCYVEKGNVLYVEL